MLLVSRVKKDRCIKQELNKNIDIIDLVNLKRSDIPAVTHVDYSARIQSINRRDHEKYHDVIEAFKDKTNVAVIVNTSFNVRGEPIVCTPEDAYKCFMRTDMDILILENYLLKKEDQEEYVDDKDWKKEYKLD